MPKKKALAYFLISSFLFTFALSGCNQIQSTLDQDDNQATDDDQNLSTQHELTGKSYTDYYVEFAKYPISKAEPPIEEPEFTNRIVTIPEPCPEDADGPCGFDLYIVTDENWETAGSKIQTFYFEEQSATIPLYYGPFEDDLSRIIKEIKELHPDIEVGNQDQNDQDQDDQNPSTDQQSYQNDIFSISFPTNWYHTTENLHSDASINMDFFGDTEPQNSNSYYGTAGPERGTLILIYVDDISDRGYFGGLSTPDSEEETEIISKQAATKRVWKNWGDFNAKVIGYTQEIHVKGEKKYLHMEVELSGDDREQGEADFHKIIGSIKIN